MIEERGGNKEKGREQREEEKNEETARARRTTNLNEQTQDHQQKLLKGKHYTFNTYV